MASIRLLATLHSGHTGFRDSWLDDSDGMPLGVDARDLDGRWTVTTSGVPGISQGDVVETIDGTPIQQFFDNARQYLADSSLRAQETDLFSTGYLFPRKFVVGLSGNSSVTVDRAQHSSARPGEAGVTGRWIQDHAIAYIKIPAFDGVTYQAKALELVHEFKSASVLIIDLRGNPGGRGDPPRELQMALMNKPYRSWIETDPTMIGRLSTMGYLQASVSSGPLWVHPEGRPEAGIFRGRLLLLVDRVCASYCEDFLMPFKASGRAPLIGETTAGTYAQTFSLDLEDGMSVLIAATAEHFPDGSDFEGVGIQPDFPVSLTPVDVRNGTDVFIRKALQVQGTSE
jgi:carboxyl-terminal processing protease